MKKFAILALLLVSCLVATGRSTVGQQVCEFNIIGTWKATTPGDKGTVFYRFDTGGRVTVLEGSRSVPASEPHEIATATYELDDTRSPKLISFTAVSQTQLFGKGPMKIIGYDDTSITCELPGSASTRWVKVDPNRYFIVLAARNGEFYDTSGPAFPILIKMLGSETQIDAVGTYSDHGKAAFGPVPAEASKDFMREARGNSEVMLRLEINGAQYERSLKILRTWQRRANEGALLYINNSPLNNVLLVKAVTETLNQCGNEINLYKLNYIHPEDWLSDNYAPQFIPFFYFRELRRLNESRHVPDTSFQQASAR